MQISWKHTRRRTDTGVPGKLWMELIFLLLVFAAILCFAVVQPFGDPPDEINRFKVVRYICAHGSLPRGDDPEVLLDGYGASYAFQPMLTYIIQGFLLRFLGIFTSEASALLLAARMVNVVFGVLTAWFVRRIAKEAWGDTLTAWTFSVMVMFLPQHLFLHSYVNTDSMAMLSTAMIFYALLRAQRTGYEKTELLLLSLGIIFCAMSYYNAYGIILAAILIFGLEYVHLEAEALPVEGSGLYAEVENSHAGGNIPLEEKIIRAGEENEKSSCGKKRRKRRRIRVDWKPLFQKGGQISGLVLAGIGWWFLRNAFLYQGDLIAMEARRQCAILTAAEEFNPLTRFTYQGAGKSLREMLFETGYLTLLRDSFIAMFGPMQIPTHGLIYLGYQWLWIVLGGAALLPLERISGLFRRGRSVPAEKTGSMAVKGVGNMSGERVSSRSGYAKGVDSRFAQEAGFMPAEEAESAPVGSLGGRRSLESLEAVKEWNRKDNKGRWRIFYGSMLLFCLITIGLSIYYSYTWEYQPQGRYILPILIPMMYGMTKGIRKLSGLCGSWICLGIMGYVFLSFGYSVFDRFLPFYLG